MKFTANMESPLSPPKTPVDVISPRCKTAMSEASCRRSISDFEGLIKEKRQELHKLHLIGNELKSDFTNIEIREKGRQEEVLKSGLQDIKFLEKTLHSMVNDDENESAFLKKQTAVLVNEKIKLQQHVISLSSRVGNTELDVFKDAA